MPPTPAKEHPPFLIHTDNGPVVAFGREGWRSGQTVAVPFRPGEQYRVTLGRRDAPVGLTDWLEVTSFWRVRDARLEQNNDLGPMPWDCATARQVSYIEDMLHRKQFESTPEGVTVGSASVDFDRDNVAAMSKVTASRLIDLLQQCADRPSVGPRFAQDGAQNWVVRDVPADSSPGDRVAVTKRSGEVADVILRERGHDQDGDFWTFQRADATKTAHVSLDHHPSNLHHLAVRDYLTPADLPAEKRTHKRLTFDLDADLHAALKILAVQQDSTIKDVATRALEQYVADATARGSDGLHPTA